MTSKISLRKLIASDMKRRNWLIILISLAGFFIYPVMYCMSLVQAREIYDQQLGAAPFKEIMPLSQRYSAVAGNYFGGEGSLLTFLVAVAAVLTAYTGFSWLHSKAQTDFYAGMPVRRVHLFLVPYVSGILIAVIPYLVCTLVALLGVGAVFGNVTPEVLKVCVPGIIWGIVGYLAVYTAAVLAMLLTGRGVLGLAVMGFLFFYGPLVYLLILMLAENCYDTYYSPGGLGPVARFSPLTLVSQLPSDRVAGLLIIIYLVAALVLCVFVMERRPMERAETPFVHPFIAPCLKVLTGVPAAMFTGALFGEITNFSEGALGWEIFWCFAAALVFSVVFEMILSTDVRNLLGHWRSTAVVFAGVLGLVCIFHLDLMGYDRFLPGEEKIESMAIGQERLYDGFLNGAYVNQDNKAPSGESLDVYLMDQTLTDNFAPIYALAREGVLGPAEENGYPVTVRYHLKSGRDVYRCYKVSLDTVSAALTELCEDRAYRDAAYPFRYLKEGYLEDLFLCSWKITAQNSVEMVLTEAERTELARCLREDAREANAGILLGTDPLGCIMVQTPYTSEEDAVDLAGFTSEILIYPGYARTLAFFRDRGWEPMETENIEGVERITVWRDNDECMITDPADIETFFACVVKPRPVSQRDYENTVYVEIDMLDGATLGDSAAITDPALFEKLMSAR